MKSKKTTNSKRKTANKKARSRKDPAIPNFHWSAFDEKVRSPTKMKALAQELLLGVKEGRYSCLEEFLFEHYIDYENEWSKWTLQSPELDKAYRIAKKGWYTRRTKLAEEKKCDARIIADLWHYSKRHQDKVKWITQLKAEGDQAANNAHFGSIIIHSNGEKFIVGDDENRNTD